MFGHVTANAASLTDQEMQRYRAAYCGLCHRLGERHGLCARMSLSYDLTFLTLLLSSLYEPEEELGQCRCIIHPVRQHFYMKNELTDYAADIAVALSYHKCLDDWCDERSITKKAYASLIKSSYENVREKWKRQCDCIERELKLLAEIESDDSRARADEAANSFGRLMAELFVYENDRWEDQLRTIGFGLGRFIYLADAMIDYDDDLKSGSYNPLVGIELNNDDMRSVLKGFLGDVSQAFEILPLVQDVNILRNILYSGVWSKINQAIRPKGSENTDDRGSL